MMRTLSRDQIVEQLALIEQPGSIDLMTEIEAGFIAYSKGRAVVPPVGELLFEQPPGDVHIKYGYIRGEEHYVIKIASGFYDNPKRGLASSNGMMLLFEQQTGRLVVALHDEGYLTDVRTAVAGAIAARLLAPKKIERIGIVGTGVQARLQLRYLRPVTSCAEVVVWGRSQASLDLYREQMSAEGYRVEVTTDPARVGGSANLIVTTTPSKEPILRASDLGDGEVHITAMGSDTPGKQELDAAILARADRVVVDSRDQCVERGEAAHAVRQGLIELSALRELGELLVEEAGSSRGGLSVADLTGVAVQDIQIAKAVYQSHQGSAALKPSTIKGYE